MRGQPFAGIVALLVLAGHGVGQQAPQEVVHSAWALTVAPPSFAGLHEWMEGHRAAGDVCGCPVGPDGCVWARADYLYWWLTGARVPALATASPPGTAQVAAGVIGSPGTVVLFGDDRLDDEGRHGLRLRAGAWLNQRRTLGVEASYLALQGGGSRLAAGSPDGNQILSRPFVNAQTGLADAELVAFPRVLAGEVAVEQGTSQLRGVDVLFRGNLGCGTVRMTGLCEEDPAWFRLDLLGGYRYLTFGDGIRVREDLRLLAPVFVPGTQILITDDFAARNRFHGGTVGLSAEVVWGAWTLETQTRLGIGQTTRRVVIRGESITLVPGTTAETGTGGLLAQSSNIGSHSSSETTLVPELDIVLGCRVLPHLRLLAGYSLIVWPAVARAAEQIDPVVNRNLLPPVLPLAGPARPGFQLQKSDLWAQGLTLGVECTY